MKPRVKQALQFIVFFGLGIGLMWWQFSRFKPEEKEQFFSGLRNANYGWFAVALLIGALAHLSRAVRWNQLLLALGHKTGLGHRFYAVMIGYLANYGIPRSGEVIRCGVFSTDAGVPFAEAFGTVIVERIIDTLCLGIVFLLVLVFEFAQLSSLWAEYIWDPGKIWLAHKLANTTTVVIIVGGTVAVVLLLLVFRKQIRSRIGGKLGKFLGGFKNGILAVRKVPNPGWFIFHSLFIWSGYLASLYVCFFCFPETSGLNMNTALLLLLFGTFGVIFTPGGIGAYQIIITALLIRLVPATTPAAAPFSWLSWGAQVGTVVLFCGAAAIFKPSLNKAGK